jgi:hypothetical protein
LGYAYFLAPCGDLKTFKITYFSEFWSFQFRLFDEIWPIKVKSKEKEIEKVADALLIPAKHYIC